MEKQILFQSLISIFFISLVSLTGITILILKDKKLQKNLQIYLISFAAGAMLSTVFFKMFPESLETLKSTVLVGKLIILGIILSFILEKIICWRHCHLPITKNHKHRFAYINIIGDLFHNFLDGIAIASAYSVNSQLGIITTLAVISHEIPQEIGDFGVLIYSGFSYKKAAIYNFLTALSAFLGGLIVIFFQKSVFNFKVFIPVIMGNFLYLATTDLIPELHKETRIKKSLLQLLFLLLGVFVIYKM